MLRVLRRRWARGIASMLLGLLLINGVLVAQRTGLDIGDIQGKPSKIAMAQGSRKAPKVQRSNDQRKSAYRKGYEDGSRNAATNLAKAQSSDKLKKTAQLPPKVKPKPTIKIDHQQTVVLKFVAENSRPVANLSVSALTASQGGQPTENVKPTDTRGQLTLQGLGLPVSLELKLPKNADTNLPDEWQFHHPSSAFLVLDHYQGSPSIAEAQPLEPAGILMACASPDIFGLFARVTSKRTGTTTKRPAPPAQTNKTITVKHEYLAEAIVLERNFVDFEMNLPEGQENAQITKAPVLPSGEPLGKASESGSAEQVITAQREGRKAIFRLQRAELSQGCIPLRVSNTTSGGEFETVVKEYKTDPYAPANRIDVPPLKLVRLNDVQLPQGVDVLSPASDAERIFPERKRRKTDNGDGSLSWRNEATGVEFRERELATAPKDKKGNPTVSVIEAIRLTTPTAGSVGGIHVGDNASDVEKQLGPPESRGNDFLSYMEQGLKYYVASGTVTVIEVLRPSQLLKEGTTAFVPRQPAKVFVEDFQTDPKRMVTDKAAFEQYLLRTGVVKLAPNREDADYTLACSLDKFKEDKGQLFGEVPLKYECSGDLSATLHDMAKDVDILRDEKFSSKVKADWMKEVVGGAILLTILMQKFNNDLLRVLFAFLGAAGVNELKQSMGHVVQRCPRLVEQSLYNQLSDKLYKQVDFSGRVTSIDYMKGEMTVNLGTKNGIRIAGAGGVPTTFDVFIAGTEMPHKEGGLSANFYTAEVLNADEDSCRCTLKHVTRKFEGKVKEVLKTEDALDMLRCIPQPQSGVVSVRARDRLVSINDL